MIDRFSILLAIVSSEKWIAYIEGSLFFLFWPNEEITFQRITNVFFLDQKKTSSVPYCCMFLL